MGENIKILEKFTIDSIPDLDVVTLGALELFAETSVPVVDFKQFNRPLVVGSVNGAIAGELIFSDANSVFADESDYLEKISVNADIDGAFLLSASGAKHAIVIARELTERGIDTVLLTNNNEAPAAQYLQKENVHTFPKNREPYTYNTSTYMGMMLSKTHEDPIALISFIQNQVLPTIPDNLSKYKAFCLIIPPHYNAMSAMFRTKFDELFGPELVGRSFTTEQMKHAKTVVLSDKECFLAFGEENTMFGLPENRITIPLPEGHNLATMLAITYFVIGYIQKQFPPYFKRDIAKYVEGASNIFGAKIDVIVE
jgi:hypothetical protein